jgi:hypothetical protein
LHLFDLFLRYFRASFMAASALNGYSYQLRILSNIKANEVLLAALKLANPSGDNRQWIANLEAENCELKSWSTLYEPFQLWFALKYRPDQPRVPAGNPDGGQWTDDGGGSGGTGGSAAGGSRLVSGRGRFGGAIAKKPETGPTTPDGTSVQLAQTGGGGRRSGSSSGRMIGGRRIQTTPQEETRIQLSAMNAEAAVRRVQERDPNWKPQPGLYDSAEGEIRNNERITREADYRMMELGRGAQPVYEWTPYGFRTAQNYTGFRQSIRDGLRDAGYKDVRVFMRGSAVTGRNFNQNSPFDGAYRSDYDLALVSPSMWRRLSDLGVPMRTERTRSAPLKKEVLDILGIGNLKRSLHAQTGR